MKPKAASTRQKFAALARRFWDRVKIALGKVVFAFFKLLDVLRIGPFLDKFWSVIKFNTRKLTSIERQEAEKVFAGSLDYERIRIDERSIIAALGAYFQGADGMGVTLFHTINFNKKLRAEPGNHDMAWLIHELTHVAQYRQIGSRYLPEAIHAQATTGYDYGGGASISEKNFRDFNREQQGDIIKDYYLDVAYGSSPFADDYERLRREMIDGLV